MACMCACMLVRTNYLLAVCCKAPPLVRLVGNNLQSATLACLAACQACEPGESSAVIWHVCGKGT